MQNNTTDLSSIPLDNLGAVTGGYRDDAKPRPIPDATSPGPDRCYAPPTPAASPGPAPMGQKPPRAPTQDMTPIPLHGKY